MKAPELEPAKPGVVIVFGDSFARESSPRMRALRGQKLVREALAPSRPPAPRDVSRFLVAFLVGVLVGELAIAWLYVFAKVVTS